MRFNKSLFTSIFLATLINAAPAFATGYIYTDLGTLGGANSEGNGINSSGQVVGSSDIGTGYSSSHPFLYSNGRMQDLGTLGGSRFGSANAINNSGQIVGYSSTSGNVSINPFLYSNGTMQDLGAVGGAIGINGSGQVVGDIYITNGTHPFLYSNGKITDIGTLPRATFLNMAYGINNSGQISGWSSVIVNNSGQTAFKPFLYSNGTMQDLGTLGGNKSFGQGLNDQGQVVGYSTLAGDITGHAFLYSNGSMQDIGSLGGNSFAYRINNSSQVVGESYLVPNPTAEDIRHAFIYSNGVMADLNSFLDASTKNSGWYLSTANDINDNGWIVGTAMNTITGASHAYVLSIAEVPETDTYAMLLAGLSVLAFVARRNKGMTFHS
jgi:probable HAF family extracellular repeat protein